MPQQLLSNRHGRRLQAVGRVVRRERSRPDATFVARQVRQQTGLIRRRELAEELLRLITRQIEEPRGAFSRQLVLGDNVDLEKVEANYDNGVLRLLIPVAETAKPRKIEIATGGRSEQTAISS